MPSPAGEGWVRGNQNKEKSLFKSPHPIPFDVAQGMLLPEGEWGHVLKSTALRDEVCVKKLLNNYLIFLGTLKVQLSKTDKLQWHNIN